MKKKVLVVDIGGTHVKLLRAPRDRRMFDSGPTMRPKELVAQIKKNAADWSFEAISIGFPAPVQSGRIAKEPKHLGKGWVGFDFCAALGKPVHVINDAAMQALGSYHGGRMLFLGLGTGLGSTLVLRDMVFPLELGDLPYCDDRIIEDFLGKPGIAELGEKEWECIVMGAVTQLKKSFIADYVVLGGGSTKKLSELPEGAEQGHNRNAYLGGIRLWQTDPRTRRPKWKIM